MSGLPPLPAGFQLRGGPALPARDPDLLKPLLDMGVVPTNGYRTPADIQRLRAEGYNPAPNSLHLNGDAVDLTPGKSGLTLQQGTPETPNAGIPPLPVGARLVQRGSLQSGGGMFAQPRAALASSTALTPLALTGQAHDGDTVRLSNGRNGRLFGFDAFELSQQGRRADGSLVPLGSQARNFMLSQIGAGGNAYPTGAQTYGRPVVNLSTDPMTDPAHDALRLGYGTAEPDYLNGSPQFGPYMEAERLARLNRLGGFQTNAETPSQFRHGNGPWASAQPDVYGQGADATFFDQPTPFQGLRPDIAKGYLAIWDDPQSKPDDLVAYASANGFSIDPAKTRKAYAHRDDPRYSRTDKLSYERLPKPLIDPGDGRFGTTMRGVGDAFNVLDELGGVVDAVGGTSGRENVFNSDRRFGDILYNNIDQNRAIIGHDEATHPYYRFGGQVAGSLAIPLAGELNVPRLAAVGATEAGLAGFGAGEGGVTQRLPNAVLAAAGGAVAGPVLGLTAEHLVTPLARRALATFNRMRARRLADGAAAASDIPPPTPGFTVEHPSATEPPIQPQSSAAPALPPVRHGFTLQGPQIAAMGADLGPELVGPLARRPDVIDVRGLPPLPEGFALAAPFGVTRQMGDRLAPEEMAKLAEGVDPASVLPRPANVVGSLEEAMKANQGRFAELQPPDEFSALPVRTVTASTGGKVKMRGPLDITQSLRLMGGVKDDGGDLAHLGITNQARRMSFGSNEQFLGRLINNDSGMSLDDAALRLWEEGYFPGVRERPTPADLLDRLHDESTGTHRYFHPDDLAHVADFHAAQAERGRIDQAEASGSPLVDERGSTINLDDLAANNPPASAYEDAPRLTGKIGNINLDRLAKPGDVSALVDQVASRVGGFDAAARGRVTNEETQRLAQEMGVKPEQLLRRQQGQALNAEQLYASRALVQRSRETVVRLAQKAIGGSDEDLATFRKAWLRHAALEEHIAGATAEAGRALQQFKMMASAKDSSGEAIRAYLRGGGGRDNIEDAARAIVDLSEDPAKANRFIAESVKPTWHDKFNELWVNSLLSGPRTHVVNFVGNAVTTAAMIPEQALTAGIGALSRSADRSTIGEVGARLRGMVNGSLEGLRALRGAAGDFVRSPGDWLASEHGPADMAMKVENARFHAIGGRAGQVVRLPTRALTAADEFWKSINRNAELHALAYREATKSAGDPAAWDSTYERLLQSPTDDMQKRAGEAARYYTFQKELGPTGKLVSQLSNTMPGGKLLIPFVKTPINLLKFAGERSVFAPAMPSVRAALMAGGRARDEALAKITLGSGLSTAAVLGALQGRVSGGGPSDPAQRATLLQSGWQPYSFRIGDRWVSYSRFDPFSTLFGVAADFADAGNWATKKEADAVALNLAEGIAKNVTNKTWLSGLSDAFDVLSDPERYGKSYVQRLTASMAVPALVSQTAQSMDPNLRAARSIVDAIKARVPVLSRSVPVRRNIWGDPVTSGDALGPDILSPFYATTASRDPLSQEVARLQAPVSMPQRFITVEGQRRELNAQQYDEFVQLTGKPARAALAQAIRSPDWRAMTDEERREEVKSTFADMREAARDTLIERHPELAKAAGAPPNLISALRDAPRKSAPGLPPLPAGFRLAH